MSGSVNCCKKNKKSFEKGVDKNIYMKYYNVVADEQQQNVRLAQLDRAFGYGPKGREFESSSARKTL